MITVTIDIQLLRAAHITALRADAVGDYVNLRQQIRRALNEHRSLEVYVTSPVVAYALSDLRGYTTITWNIIEPRLLFERLFNQSPLPLLDAVSLATLELDTLPQPPVPNDPTSWILQHRLDPLFGHTTPPSAHATAVLTWAISAAPLAPAIGVLLDAQLARWGNIYPMYHALRSGHMRDDAYALLARAALKQYHPRWLETHLLVNRPLVDLRGLEDATIKALDQRSRAISEYWQRWYAEHNGNELLIEEALNQMSGLSQSEFVQLDTMLQDHPELLTTQLIERIAQRFERPAFRSRRDALARRVAPNVPATPQDSWDDDQWLSWATEIYMPYFVWVVRTNAARTKQEQLALAFSDWLYQRYPAWLTSDTSPVLTRQYRDLRDLIDAEPQSVILWLIVDNLPWWQGELLINACREQALFVQICAAGIAALPSITSISKRALITGVTTPEKSSLSVAVVGEKHFAARGIRTHVTYKFAEALAAFDRPDRPTCVVLLANMLDVVAHKLSTFSDTSVINGILNELASNLGQVRERCERQGQNLHIFIGSDHGSTLLPNAAALQPLPHDTRIVDDSWAPASENTELPRSSNRAAAVVSSTILTEEQRDQWYLLSRERFSLDQDYVVPRGYGYIGRRPEGWTHGGLTPEEVIVPLIHLCAVPPQRLSIEVLITGTLRANHAGSLAVTLRNPNRQPVTALTLQLTATQDVIVDRIDASQSVTQHVIVAAPETSASEIEIIWQLHYRLLGEIQQQKGTQRISVRRLSTSIDGIDDMFGD